MQEQALVLLVLVLVEAAAVATVQIVAHRVVVEGVLAVIRRSVPRQSPSARPASFAPSAATAATVEQA